VSRSWASREANAPGTRNLLAELLELHRERVNKLFDQTLDVIEDAMKARKIFVVKGVIVDGGPDHLCPIGSGENVYPVDASRRPREVIRPGPSAARRERAPPPRRPTPGEGRNSSSMARYAERPGHARRAVERGRGKVRYAVYGRKTNRHPDCRFAVSFRAPSRQPFLFSPALLLLSLLCTTSGELCALVYAIVTAWPPALVYGLLTVRTLDSKQTPEATLADGILDRPVRNAHRIEMRGDSMRKNRGKPGA
jgi:hypothetical protein